MFNILGDIKKGVIMHSQVNNLFNYSVFIFEIDQKDIIVALTYDGRLSSIEEEINQFKKSGIHDLVPCPQNKTIIGTKCIFLEKY